MIKRLLATLTLWPALLFCGQSTSTTTTTETPVMTITLLGTGVPLLDPLAYISTGRFTSSLLIQAGGDKYLFDCGQGALTRLLQSGGPTSDPNVDVNKVFISHLHSDHIADLAALYVYGWLYRYNTPLQVWGPGPGHPPCEKILGTASNGNPLVTCDSIYGTGPMMLFFRSAFSADIWVRSMGFTNPEDPILPQSGVQPIGYELREGVIYDNNGVKITAFLVDHDPVTPAYGFRVEYQGHSVVYSGDTTFTPNLVKHAKNADLVIIEAWGYPQSSGPELYNYHCPPETCIAPTLSQVTPKMGVLTHLAVPTTTDDLVTRIRNAGYGGPLTVGADLMQIQINSDGTIGVTPPTQTAARPIAPEGFLPAEMRGMRSPQ